MIFQQNAKTKEPWTNDQKFEITTFAVLLAAGLIILHVTSTCRLSRKDLLVQLHVVITLTVQFIHIIHFKCEETTKGIDCFLIFYSGLVLTFCHRFNRVYSVCLLAIALYAAYTTDLFSLITPENNVIGHVY